MYVMHLLAPAEVGGLERVVGTLSAAQGRAGMRVLVATVGGDLRAMQSASTGEGLGEVEFVSIPVKRRGYLSERQAVARLLRTRRPDILHTHGYRPDVLDSPVARVVGIPTVTTVHGFTGGGLKNRFYEWLQKRSFRSFDAVVAVSRDIVERLVRFGVRSEAIHLVRNAWHSDRKLLPRTLARNELGLGPDEAIVGWVGRLTPEKGPDLMLQAMQRLEIPQARLCILGAGAMDLRLKRLAKDLGIQNEVSWPGVVPDAHRLFTAFDVLVVSSWTEGTPMVLLEAMAAEVPIVTTAVGGIPDMLSPSEAVLVPPGDPDALAAAIGTVLSDHRRARVLARRAMERLLHEFAVEPWVRRYLDIYLGVARQSPRRAVR